MEEMLEMIEYKKIIGVSQEQIEQLVMNVKVQHKD